MHFYIRKRPKNVPGRGTKIWRRLLKKSRRQIFKSRRQIFKTRRRVKMYNYAVLHSATLLTKHMLNEE